MSQPNLFFRILRGIARWADRLRKTLHFLFLFLILVLLLAVLTPAVPVVPPSAALVLAPQGVLVEELSGDPLQRALALAQGISMGETLSSDLIRAVRRAAGDTRIGALVLDLDRLSGAGLSKLQDLGAEIDSFRETGKPVFAVGSSYERDQYLLAAHADRIFMHPMGVVLIDGYSTFIPYYKSALEKLYVDYNTWTVGEYKSLFEPATRQDMSDEDREARSSYLNAMWDNYQHDVTQARALPATDLQRYADEFAELLRGADGDAGRLAVEYGLVDELLPYDLAEEQIRAVVGGDAGEGYARVDHRAYLAALDAVALPALQRDRIAVLVAAGTIQDGLLAPGSVGSESMVRRIRAARIDEAIRALVLRIDSPGGSAFASDVILRELELFRQTGKPLVVSMGSVAASGGYWIALSADEIWASPSTLTGSIGVGAAIPSFQRALARIGISVDGLGTTELAGQMDPLQGIGPDISEYMQLSTGQVYEQFTTLVAEHRQQDIEDVYDSAEGRVWIGSEAERRGLVDRLGTLDQAIESAAALAGLEPDSYSIERLAPELTWADRLLLGGVRVAAPILPALGADGLVPESIRRILDAASEPLVFLEQFNDPRGTYVYCFCDVD